MVMDNCDVCVIMAGVLMKKEEVDDDDDDNESEEGELALGKAEADEELSEGDAAAAAC
jgi:hypothetical protein